MLETIPIPRERARNAEDFQLRVTDLYAWPDQELHLEFEFNDEMGDAGRWVWSIEHSRHGRLWPKGVATLGYEYSAWPYLLARFKDTSGEAEAVTPDNLGRTVVLTVLPGPLGGDFHPDADVDEAEAERLLRRREWQPVR